MAASSVHSEHVDSMMRRFWDQQPPYDGADTNLDEENGCKNCFKKKENLMTCSRCKVAFYCSRDCQKEDFPQHAARCKTLARLVQDMDQEADKLRSIDLGFGRRPNENLFETQVGHFWSILETRDYMRARNKVMNGIYEFAYEDETRELWEKTLHHHLEMLRLCSGDNIGVRFRTPFVLLYLNRDDDAYAFCRYWINVDSVDPQEREQVHRNSKEGDWIYPRQNNCRFNDIFQDCSRSDPNYISLSFLVAVCIIKMRLVAAYEAKKQSVHQFSQTTKGETIREVQSVITEFSAGEASMAETQRQQVDRLLDVIHQNNPTMLPSIINPMPLKRQPSPQFYSPGTPSEAHGVLMDCNRAFVRVPVATAWLEGRFGRNPTYNHDMSL